MAVSDRVYEEEWTPRFDRTNLPDDAAKLLLDKIYPISDAVDNAAKLTPEGGEWFYTRKEGTREEEGEAGRQMANDQAARSEQRTRGGRLSPPPPPPPTDRGAL